MRFFLVFVASFFWITAVSAQVAVKLDSTVKFQTIEGWGHGSADLGLGWGAVDAVNYQYIDYLTDDLGLTGTRIQEVGPRSDGSGTDDGDCDVIDWNKFQPGPKKYFDYMVYFKNRVLAEGYQPSFYSSTGYASSSSGQKPWVLDDPGERAQQIWANALYWRDHYGLDINYAVIANEPQGARTPQLLVDDIKALAPRLATRGLKTRIQFPESVAPKTSWEYISAVKNDADLWPLVGRISYHNYGTADPYRSYIRDFGIAKGIPTAQTEMDPNNIDNLFDDLILGGVSYWEVAYSNSNIVNPNPGYTSFTPSRYYFRIRQVTHYVRPGDVRIGAESSDPAIRVLAFTRRNAMTTVIYNSGQTPMTVTVSGLPPGEYGLSQAAESVIAFQELGIQTVGADGTLTLNLGKKVAATLYPNPSPNQPPTIMTWGSNPGVIEAPETTSTLSVTANDATLAPLNYHWSLVSQPAGASVALASPDAATTSVSGLNVSGTYVFNVDVGDGVNTSSKKASLVRYESNQPPVLGFTGFRFDSPYGTILDMPNADGTPLHTNISLPTSSGILQANVSDLEKDAMTAKWSVISQPPGAAVTLSDTTYIYVSFRSKISGMTVPGDYVFEIAVSDGHNALKTAQVICTVQPPNIPPVINSIIASPNIINSPNTTTQFSTTTSDANGDLLRYWWVVKSAPPNAKPVFDHQGLPDCTVSNLTVSGVYVFTLRAFDDISMTTKDVYVKVNSSP